MISSKLLFSQDTIVHYNFSNFENIEYLTYFKNDKIENNIIKLTYFNKIFYPRFLEYNKSWQICNYSNSVDILSCRHEGALTTNIFIINKNKDTSFISSNFIAEKIELFSYKNILNIIIIKENYARIIFYDINNTIFSNENSIDVRTKYKLKGDSLEYTCNFYPFIEKEKLVIKFIVTTSNINNKIKNIKIYNFHVLMQNMTIFKDSNIILTDYEIFYSKFLTP